MPTRSPHSYPKVSLRTANFLHHDHIDHIQHGSPLLNLPQESLTHITSYLPLPSLFSLASTCRRLCEHLDDDNTWLRAFLTQFLGISPEHELDNHHILLLRRTEQSWRKEFIHHYTINRCVALSPMPLRLSFASQTLDPLGQFDRLLCTTGLVHRCHPSHGRRCPVDVIPAVRYRRTLHPPQRKGTPRLH